jgi:hypothetical protein
MIKINKIKQRRLLSVYQFKSHIKDDVSYALGQLGGLHAADGSWGCYWCVGSYVPVVSFSNTDLTTGRYWKKLVKFIIPKAHIYERKSGVPPKDGRQKQPYIWSIIRRCDVVKFVEAVVPHTQHNKAKVGKSILMTFGKNGDMSRESRYLCHYDTILLNRKGTKKPAPPVWRYRKPPKF